MACCKVESVVIQSEDHYVLTLTEEEAKFLYRLLGHHIYGSDEIGLRTASSRIFTAIQPFFGGYLDPLPCVIGNDRIYLIGGDS